MTMLVRVLGMIVVEVADMVTVPLGVAVRVSMVRLLMTLNAKDGVLDGLEGRDLDMPRLHADGENQDRNGHKNKRTLIVTHRLLDSISACNKKVEQRRECRENE